MQKQFLVTMLLVLTCLGMTAQKSVVRSNGYPITQVPFTAVKVASQTFWGERIRAAREVTIPLAFSKCESEGRYRNFVQCQTPSADYPPSGFSFDDTDVYKTIEGASYVLQTYPDPQLEHYIDSVLDIVAAAQEPDGYLYTPRTMNPWHPHSWSGQKRWEKEEVLSHELYNLGHMVDAACAHYQATGSRKFLDIARRYADCVVREVGPRQGQACVVPGHQIAEMALARLFLLTGEKSYLDEAKFFLDYRGKTKIHDVYTQSDRPISEQKEAWGHAVRAGYMYASIADVAALTGDSVYLKVIDRICDNIIGRKYYLTGGVGARHEGEAFGADYELPNLTAYNETCAAISMVYLFHRMFLLHGDAKYIDCMERTLYNGVISGMSVDGGRFFYPNPLSSDGHYRFNADGTVERQPWFGCACCPSNLCRFIPSLPGYVYAVKGRQLYVNLFTGSTATIKMDGREVVLEQQTDYPWDGNLRLIVQKNQAKDFSLMIRIPGWAQGKPVPSELYRYSDDVLPAISCKVNGKPVEVTTERGYLRIQRVWKKGDSVELHFDMPARMVKASPHVVEDRGRVAVERGPLVYCAEGADNNLNIFNFLVPRTPQMQIADFTVIGQHQVRFDVKSILLQGEELQVDAQGMAKVQPAQLMLIPYYAWNHRGAGKMEVWLPQSISALGNY